MNRNTLRQLVREGLEEFFLKEDEPINPEPQPEIPVTEPAQAPVIPPGSVTKSQAKEIILGTSPRYGGNGGFFTVTFVKKDGSVRTMNARLGVVKHLRGGSLRWDARGLGFIPVYDMVNKGYRMINSSTITALNVGGKRYEVREDMPQVAQQQQQAAQETSPEAMEEIKRMRQLANIK
jgi:hypothetical protein